MLVLTVVSLSYCQYKVQRQDPFALLSATLQTYQEASCDNQVLSLECPSGTKISIQLVQYGRSAPSNQVCPPTREFPKVYEGTENLDCHFPEALKFIEEKCHGQELCSLITAPEIFSRDVDPCPGYRKYVETAFKCKPTQFRSRVVCHGDSMSLSCDKPDQRLAIYSASFASAEGSHVFCPSRRQRPVSSMRKDGGSDATNEEESDYLDKYGMTDLAKCEASYATEAVMQICHGRQSCVILADGDSLGAPSCSNSENIYLKTVYTCVNRDVFQAQYRYIFDEASGKEVLESDKDKPATSTPVPESTLTPAESGLSVKEMNAEYSIEAETMLGDPSVQVERNPFQPLDILDGQRDPSGLDGSVSSQETDATTQQTDMVVGFVSDFMSSYQHIRLHKEKFIIFACLSVALGLLLFLGMLVWGMYRSHRLARIKASMQRPPSIINAYYTSPAGSPSAHSPPAGFIDLDQEIGDHEVDTAFRDPLPEPLIIAPQRTSPNPVYGTLGRRISMDNFVPHTCDNNTRVSTIVHSPSSHFPGTQQGHHHTPSWSGSTINPPPLTGILRNSNRDSPANSSLAGSDQPAKSVRYSTVGRPRVTSPSSRSPLMSPDNDFADPRSLTLSRLTNADHILYG